MLSSRSRQVREKNFTRSIDWGGGRVVSTLNNVHGQDKFKLLDRSMLRHVWCSLAGGVCVCGCVGVGGGGGGHSLKWPIRGGSARKGYLFSLTLRKANFVIRNNDLK